MARAVRDSSRVQGVVSAQDSSETSGLQRAIVDMGKTVAGLMMADRTWREYSIRV
jgi:hypothetical protein